jgi:hypothetical protein
MGASPRGISRIRGEDGVARGVSLVELFARVGQRPRRRARAARSTTLPKHVGRPDATRRGPDPLRGW